ncbi:MAG: hypothetical protein AAFY65_15155 [Pseudomonadota bacterium]
MSYWDPGHHGLVVGPVELCLVLALTVWLWRQHTGWGMRLALIALALAQMSVGGVWALVFA